MKGYLKSDRGSRAQAFDCSFNPELVTQVDAATIDSAAIDNEAKKGLASHLALK